MRIEAGRFKGRRLPRARAARPVGGRLRRSLLGALADRLEGARVLDLFAGVGALGLEALSRGARRVVLVDRDARAVAALRAWLRDVGAAPSEALAVRRELPRQAPPEGPFDLVFLDPPFPLWEGAGVRAVLGRAVDALAPAGLVAVKMPPRAALPEDARWRLARRRRVGSVVWALVERVPAPGAAEADVKEGDRGADGGDSGPVRLDPDPPLD